MSDSELDYGYFRDLLNERRRQLQEVAETGAASAATVELDQTRVGRLSRMDALQGQAMSQETNRRRNLELQRIATALQRLDDDEYGVCVRCGGDIASGRLESDPSATLCIQCAGQAA